MTESLSKVLIVCPTLGLPSEVWLIRQIVGLKNFKPTILTWQSMFQENNSLPVTSISTMNFDFNRRIGLSQKVMRKLFGFSGSNLFSPTPFEHKFIHEVLEKIRPTVILCHFGYTALRVLPSARYHNTPLVVHFHGRDLSVLLQNNDYVRNLRKSLEHFSSSIVVGKHQYRLLMEKFGVPESKINLIPCGVPTDEFTPKPDFKGNQVIRFISVSRLCEEKGHIYSLKAFSNIEKFFSNVAFSIIGDGPLRAELQQFINRSNLQSKVIIEGFKNPEYVLKQLRSSDIFIQHSIESKSGWIEGFGVSIAEASSVGLPIIATAYGGISDQVIDGITGYLIEPKNIEMMADRMRELILHENKRKQMGISGRNRMIEFFDTKYQIFKLEKVLLQSCNNYSSDFFPDRCN